MVVNVMVNSARIVEQNGRLMISGDLNFSTVVMLWHESLPLLSSMAVMNFDLSNINSSNSAGVALIIGWIKYAKNANKTIQFAGIPRQLESIVRTSGIYNMML